MGPSKEEKFRISEGVGEKMSLIGYKHTHTHTALPSLQDTHTPLPSLGDAVLVPLPFTHLWSLLPIFPDLGLSRELLP